MKKRTATSLKFFTAILAVSIMMVSCNKKFDAPPYYIDPNIKANNTLMGLKTTYGSLAPGTAALLPDSVIITGEVTAEDSSGNFFKNIVIQDSTGGISIQLAGTSLYTTYNQGRNVWIKCKGLYIGNYNNSLMIGAGPGVSATTGKPLMTGIPATQISLFVIPGDMANKIKPTVVTASQLSTNLLDPLQNVLIQLDNYQFADGDLTRTYADPTLISTTAGTFYPQTCTGTNKTLELYNSNYAYFANVPVPTGKGSLIGIFTVYGTYQELEIRDTSDVKFYGLRCDGSTGGTPGGGGTGGNGADLRISDLRQMYTGTTITSLGSYTVHGVVISDAASGNISTGNVVIQDGNSGITVYFGKALTYKVGDSIVIDATGAKLQSYMGSLELDPKGTAPAAVATGKVITPNVVTSAYLAANITTLENTLVQIQNATTATGTYSGSKKLTDASGSSMVIYTLSGANFASTQTPGATPSNFTGYATVYSTSAELHLRNIADASAGPGTGGGGGGGTNTVQSLAQIRAMTPGTLGAYTIHGTVISSATGGNISKGNVVIQDGTSGISLYFGSSTTITYVPGDSIVLDVTGAKLQAFQGALEVDPVSTTLPAPVATGKSVIIRTPTIADINANIGTYEYTLVTVNGATASGGTTFSGSGRKITDASGSMTLYTVTAATFGPSTIPTGSHNWTGYPHAYTTGPEFRLRTASDVQ